MKALYFKNFGNSTVLEYGELPKPVLKADEVLVKTEYIGLNFADIYRRKGEYHIEDNEPYINGYEGAGKIVEAGIEVSQSKIGGEVLFVDVPFANAEYVAVPRDNIIYLPQGISSQLAVSVGLQGLTADFLAHDLSKPNEGDQVFITGISGGVGQILAQMLISEGISVYGSASTKAKKKLALSFGVKEVFPSREKGWSDKLAGKFDVVYDGVGKTLNQNISFLKNRGKVIFFGMAGGTPPQVDLIDLLAHSKSILTGDLWDYLINFEERQQRSQRLFSYFLNEKIAISEPTIFSLADGKKAHDYLEEGKNIGKVLLKP
ncbi:MAG: zinc-binding dehydrogenase [Tetragenococcus sp.]|nr:zinc-binding dehydrogenase [Tetragenococcus sp.]